MRNIVNQGSQKTGISFFYIFLKSKMNLKNRKYVNESKVKKGMSFVIII